MNNTHQELIAEKVAEFNKKVDDDYYEFIELTDTTQLKSTLWTEEYWPESQVELSVDKVRAFLTQTLQDTIDTVLKEERKRWVEAVGEKIDKTTRELMMASFQEGVETTKAQYDEAFKALDNTPPNKV